MPRLEDLTPGAQVTAVVPGGPVTVVSSKWHGTNVVQPGRQWSFTADGALFRLVSEALGLRLAYLSDPLLAVNTSDIEPLPHQITAVY